MGIIRTNEEVQVQLAQRSLTRDFEQVLPDINVLANERHVQQFITNKDEASLAALTEELLSFAQQKRIYSEILFLDLAGNELVHVAYEENRASSRNQAQRINVAQQSYFIESIQLGRGELYISPLHLRVEQGAIRTPHMPSMYLATPVHDSRGKSQGILVLNYMAQSMLEHFAEMLQQSHGHIALLNADGYWLYSHKPERSWGFMLGNKITFADRHPDAWERIRSSDQGQFQDKDGLFTYSTLFPVKIIGGYSEQELVDDHSGHHHIPPESYQWKIVSDVSNSLFVDKLKARLYGSSGLAWFVILALGTLVSGILAASHREKDALHTKLKLHAKLYETTTEGVIITDAGTNIIEVNRAFTDITGYSPEEVIGKKPSLLSSGIHDADFYKHMWDILQSAGKWQGEVQNRHRNGTLYTEWLRISAIRDKSGKVSNYVAILSDITSKKLSEAELHRRAHYDTLTGLHNRLSFHERLNHNLACAKRDHFRVAVLYIDLDKFKPINDTYSHQAGDLVLQETARRIQASVRDMDTVARVGGDEFVVILREVDTLSHAEGVAEKIVAAINKPVLYEGHSLRVGASYGIALYPDQAMDAEELIAIADAAMYGNKQHS